MIRLDHVSVRYPEASAPVLADIDLAVPEGELCLVVGQTGSGKSTLLRCVTGLVPHFTGGRLSGRVTVAGRDTRTHPPRELADVVGAVLQQPAAGFVTDTVEDELAYGMESLGIAPPVMRRRIEEVLDLLGLADLRGRALLSLSAGQQQRVAVGAALTPHPQVLVLDEPTSALDPPAAEEVLAALTRLVHDLGLTVLMAEHRLERVVQYADRIVWLPGSGRPVVDGPPADVLEMTVVAPPVVELGRLAGWTPLPLSIRDARRRAGPLRAQLSERRTLAECADVLTRRGGGDRVVDVRGLVARYGDIVALRGIDLTVDSGEVVAVMGRNGAGKSTLLSCLVGLRRPDAGTVVVDGIAPYAAKPAVAVRHVGLVPQEPGDLLYADTVAGEVSGDVAAIGLLDRLAPGIDKDAHPRDLSEGQRLALALAVVLSSAPPLLLLDEPTRGLDYPAKARLAAVVGDLARRGHAVVMATHDVELAATVATRVIVIADGEIVSDGPTREVVMSSPAFAPQVAKVLAPLPFLTVADVEEALAG